MFQRFDCRAGHFALLVLATAGVLLPNLGGPSLWDIDEGNNAEAAREMQDADNWITPTFNYQWRCDKPALLYWLQILAYKAWGVTEFSARLPSALSAVAAVLLTYDLGRRLLGARTGLLAGMILAAAPAFCAAGRFANPDALLNAATVLTFLFFWRGYARAGGTWFASTGLAMGLAFLAKGPVGLLLPSAAIVLFLAWSGELRRLLDRRLAWGVVTFILVMAPWYVLVGVDTKWEFLQNFFLKHNLGRFQAPMEGHGGPPYYYVLVVLAGLMPWAAFLGPAVWYTWRQPGENNKGQKGLLRVPPATRFLVCWIGVIFCFYSLSQTKLPNYVLPLYPAVAIVLAQFLERWRAREVQPPAWVLRVSLTCYGLSGLVVFIGLLIAGGLLGGAVLLHGRHLPGLEGWAAVGLLPVAGACAAGWCLRRGHRERVPIALAATGMLFVALLGAGPVQAVEAFKAPRSLAAAIHSQEQSGPEIRIAAYGYFQPSLVFYCRREVSQLGSDSETVEFLRNPLPVYLIVSAAIWDNLRTQVRTPVRLLAQSHDLYRNCEVLLVTNR
jgi:4-amino-4-deoxy-L-arabinose transferase-like glycosyltransferase